MGMQLTGAFLRKTFAPWPWSITVKHETNGPFVCTGDQTQGPHVFTLYLWIIIPPNLLFSSNKSLLQAESPSHHLQTSDTLVFPFLLSIAFKAIQPPPCKLNSHLCVYLGNGHEGLPVSKTGADHAPEFHCSWEKEKGKLWRARPMISWIA